MALAIRPPTDAKTTNLLLHHLVKERPINMGADREKVYCMTQDEHGNLRVPLGLCKMLWNIVTPLYHQLHRKSFTCSIELGWGGKDFQIPIYESLVNSLMKNQMCYLALACSSGKTMIAVKLFSQLGLKTVVLTDATLIFPQWVKVLKERTNAVVAEITSPVQILPEADIYVMMVTAAGKMHPSTLEPIKLLIVDEALYFMTPTRIPALLNFTPCYTLGLCAEIKRTDGMHAFLPHFFGPTVIRRISDKPFTVYRVETPYKPKIEYQRYTGKVNWNLVLDSLADNEERNLDIIHLCTTLPESKIIIGTKRKDQARFIFEKLKEMGEKVGLLVENARTIPQCRILVGIYAKMGKGVDVKNLCTDWEGDVFDVAILALDLCKPEQFVGRVFRHDIPVIYDLVDDYSTLRNHFEKQRMPWYRSRKGVIHKVIIKRGGKEEAPVEVKEPQRLITQK